MAVEEWLETYPHSRQMKSHVRNLMHTLYQAAIRWELVERNPVDFVRQSQKRLKTPRILTPAEFKALLGEICEPYKAMVITIACLGLRVSELVGLQWGDIDFESLTVKIQRSFVEGSVYPTKTEASESTLPLDPDLAAILLNHKAKTLLGKFGLRFRRGTGNPLAGRDARRLHQARGGKGGNWQYRLAHLQAQLFHVIARAGHKTGGPERTPAPCQHRNHDEYLYSGHFGR